MSQSINVAGSGTRDSYRHLISGAGAGFLSAIAVCPLDVLKTRLQSRHYAYNDWGILRSLRMIWAEEGIQGLYRGLSPTILGLVPTWAIFFGTYDIYRQLAGNWLSRRPDDHLCTVIGSIMAGFTNNTITNPLWVVKTRMMTLNNISKTLSKSADTVQLSGEAVRMAQDVDSGYRTTRQAMVSIWKHDGWRGFYKGFAASLIGIGHVAIQFPLYEYFKASLLIPASVAPGSVGREQQRSKHQQITFGRLLIASTFSKLVASVVTYPHEVVRTRLHNESTPPIKYKSLLGSIRTIAVEEGWRGFYRGLPTNLIRTIPASGVTLISYELIYDLLGDC
jgi:solute carrier family 25 folate transporter 32